MYIHTEILLKQHQDTENTITFTLHCWYTRHNLKPTIELILSIIILFFNNQIYRYVGTEQWRWRRSGYHFNMRATLCHQHIFTIACRSPQHIISSHTKCPQRTPSMTRRFYCINLGLNKFSSFCCCCFGSKPDFLYITAIRELSSHRECLIFLMPFPVWEAVTFPDSIFSSSMSFGIFVSHHTCSPDIYLCSNNYYATMSVMLPLLSCTNGYKYKRIVFSWLVLIWFIAGWVRVLSSFFVRVFAFRFFRV